MAEPEDMLSGFVAKFSDTNQALIRALRAALQRRFPDCNELVYDNYNFLVIGYSPSERPSDYVVSLAADKNGAGLSFNRGSELEDPTGILLGSGKVNRFIRLPDPSILDRPEVEALLNQGCTLCPVPRPWSGSSLIIRSISAKQRPRR